MTYIKIKNDATTRFHDERYMDADYWIEPSKNGVANVKSAVAESLVENDLADYHDTK